MNLSFKILTLFCCLLSFESLTQEETYFQKANHLFKQEKWEEGKKHLDKGLDESPDDADLLMLNGKYFHMNGNNDLARFNLMRCLKEDPHNTDAKQILINVEMQTEHYSAAICYVNELLEINPYWRSLWRKKIDLYKIQGNDSQANRLLKRLNQIYPEDTELQDEYKSRLQIEIIEQRKEGNIEEMLLRTDELIKLQGNSVEAYLSVINSFLVAGDKKKALIYANRALGVTPDNVDLIKKKASILAESGKLNESLLFLESEMGNNLSLKRMHDDMLIRNARFQKKSDPYVLYGKILEKNPGNIEALTFMLNTSLSKEHYSEALVYTTKAKEVLGESKELLFKEYTLYVKMGNHTVANKKLKRLFGLYPEDTGILNLYAKYQYELAKSYLAENQVREAFVPLLLIHNLQRNDYTDFVDPLLLNSYIELGNYKDALTLVNELIAQDRSNISLFFKKISVLRLMNEEETALLLYEEILDELEDAESASYMYGYEEMSLVYAKKLIENGESNRAFEIIEKVLILVPQSHLAYEYALKNAHKTNDNAMFYYYAKKAKDIHPNDVYFAAKYTEALIKYGKLEEADYFLRSVLKTHPYNELLMNINSQIALIFCKELFQQKEGDSLLGVASNALKISANNIELKYYKGLAFELKQEYDSAYYYQGFYNPAPLEENEFYHHLYWLKFKTYKNHISFYHLRSRFSDNINVSTVSSVEYIRIHDKKNTFSARVHYVGRNAGAGLLLQGEWSRVINSKWYATVNAGHGTRYFAKTILNGSLFKSFKNDFELELGLGHRYLPGIYSMQNVVVGGSKLFQKVWLNTKVNVYRNDNLILYNALINSRFYIHTDGRSYLQAMASFGSVPESGALDLTLPGYLSSFNTMVGLGFQHMVNSQLTVGALGTAYNIKSDTGYQNLYNIYFQVNYAL